MAETKQVNAGTKLESIGTVKTVVGEVKAVDAAGNERILQAGDKVFANETIVTANGGMVMIEFADGTHLDLASASKIVLDTDVFNPANAAAAPEGKELTAEQIQEMIARGEDPTAVTEASAAGAGAGDEGGSSFIVVDYNNTQGNVTSGFNTLGIPGPEGTTFTELPPVEDEAAPVEQPPEVTVVVVVTPPPTEENPNPQPGVGTNAASIVEGTAEGSKTVVFTIVLDKAFAQDVTVTYVLVDGAVGNPGAAAANNPSDYSDGAGPQTIVIPAGQTSFQVTAQIVQDGKVEADEAFSIVLVSANNATINPNASSATVTIVNDDFAPVANDDTASINMADQVPPPQSGSEEVQSPNHSVSGNVLTNDTDANFDPLAVVTPVTVSNAQGTLQIMANGNFTFTMSDAAETAAKALDSGETMVVTFTDAYKATDGDNLSDFADVTITITGTNDVPTITVNTDNPGGGNDVVFESGLSAGSNAAANSEFAEGTFTLSDPDGLDDIKSVTINGESVAIGSLVNHQFVGDHGTLTITGYTNGVASYSYQLTSSTTDNEGTEIDSFTLTTSDGTVTSAPGTITIEIVDDVPTAVADVDSIAAGAFGPATGNVITDAEGDGGADTQGADSATVTNIASVNVPANAPTGTGTLTIAGQYGVLTISANGDYSYARNAGTAGGVSDQFSYTLTDGDNDSKTTTLTINIGDSGVTTSIPAPGGDTTTVYEAGLPARTGESAGSNSAANSETTSGTVTFSSPDGLGSVSLGGHTLTTSPQTFSDGLTASYSYNPATGAGTINYSYTLADNTSGDNTNVSFAVVVTDADGDAAPAGNLVINIVDDVPTAVADVDSIAAGAFGPATGNVITDAEGDGGADTQGADSATVTNIASVNVPANAPTGTGTLTIAGQYGVLTISANGDYSYARNAGTAGGVSDQFSYTLTDGDNDSKTTTLTINIGDSGVTTSIPAPGGDTTTVYEAGLPARTGESAGSNSAANSETTSGTVTFSSPDGLGSVSLGGHTLTTSPQTFSDGLTASYSYNPATGAGTINYSYTLADNTSGDNTNVSFAVVVTDADGDAAPAGNLVINIVDDVPTAVADVDSIAAGAFGPATGNVITDAEGDGGADTQGADSATVTNIASVNVPANAPTGTGTLTIAGQYGVLTISANGDYSYARNAGTAGGVSDQFSYTLTDGDNDSKTTTLTINIGDSGVTTSIPAPGGDTTTVYEAGLPARTGESAGSNSAANSETTSGTVTFSSPDGLGSVSLGGHTLTTSPQTFSDGLTASYSYNPATGAGTINYSYTLADNTSGDNTNVSFAVVVTDADGDAAPAGNLVINIVDDVPTAVSDTAVSVAEDAVGTIGGNVLTNDKQGADSATVTHINLGSGFVAITTGTNLGGGVYSFTNSNGTYTIKADGTWTFDPVANQSNASGISAGFSYRITDGDSDISEATQPITVTDGAGPTAGAAITLTLDDQNLADGSTPAGADFVSNTITFTPGSDAISSIKFASDTSSLSGGLTWTRVSDTQIVGKDGAITIVTLDLTVVNNVATVKATLNDNYDSHPGAGDDLQALGSVGVVATDADGDTATGTVNVVVSDDVPTLSSISPATVANESSGFVTGLVNFTSGADTPTTADLSANITGWNGASTTFAASALTSGGATVYYYVNPADTSTLYAYTSTSAAAYTGAAGQSLVFTLDVDPATGKYVIDMAGKLDAETQTIGAEFNSNIGSNISYLIIGTNGAVYKPGDVLPNGVTEAIRVDSTLGNVNTSTQGISGDSQWVDKTTEFVTFDFATPAISASFSIDIKSISPGAGSGWVEWKVTDTQGHVETGYLQVVDGAVTTIPTSFTNIDIVEIGYADLAGLQAAHTGATPVEFRVTGISGITSQIEGDLNATYKVSLVDSDGDKTTDGSLNVIFEGSATILGTAGNDALGGSNINEILTGGAGNDILSGGLGSDTFVWTNGNTGTDTITDFTKGSGGDVLNFADLLQGEHQNAASLGSYLSFNCSDGNTTITIDTNGATAGGNTQQIVLQGVDLTAGNTLPTATIINNLLADGNLKTDA